jgi:hypothetical protein
MGSGLLRYAKKYAKRNTIALTTSNSQFVTAGLFDYVFYQMECS